MRLARELVTRGFVVVSGLARGMDTAAMIEAIRAGGRVIGVIGTPITECYPKENRQLQELVAAHHLLISQIPIYRASIDHFDARRTYFPRRNPKHGDSPLPILLNPPVIPHEHCPQLGFCCSPAG